MDTVIVIAASYLIWVMVGGFGLFWLLGETRRGKVELALAAGIGLVVLLAILAIAGEIYTNPRPFVADPSITPLIPHDPDNGFPSNHAAAAGLIATLVVLRRWFWGLILGLLAALVAWGRVAAHVHHLVDVTAGLALGALAALAGMLLATWLLRRTRLLERPAVRRLTEERPGRSGPGGADSLGESPGDSPDNCQGDCDSDCDGDCQAGRAHRQ